MSDKNPFTRFVFVPASSPKSSYQSNSIEQVAACSSNAKRERCGDIKNESTKLIKIEHCYKKEKKLSDRRLNLLLDIMKARESMETPIDKFGTHACVAPRVTSTKVKRFQLLVAALLSSQTQDAITYAAMYRLHHLGDSVDGLTIAYVSKISEKKLSKALKPVGFYHRKAHQLKQVAAILLSQHHGDIPRSLDELQQLPGIGPKVGRVITLLAWNQVDGIVVDTHVHRLAQRFGWATATTPKNTKKELEDWVPQKYWGKLSLAVVGFGQAICTAKLPLCSKCPLAEKCPSAFNADTRNRKII
ncbi:hypothetical protein CCR75_004040 [Bremia lactucae]|uniref:Endonuclease III homolog n=1 Tax=Bremia lactucae TaxID=4779 RepID=A0A976FF95_BRELC|nr:hypothetical protein CCR75_004040 [Bremia lactucae]